LTPRIVPGGPSYANCIAIERGPQLLALDPAANPDLPIPSSATVTEPTSCQSAGDGYVFRGIASVPDAARHQINLADTQLKLLTFADATRPIVWLPTKDHLASGPLPVTFGGAGDQSRPKLNQPRPPDCSALTDLRTDTYCTTSNRRKAALDFYAVELKQPAVVRRIVFTQGPVNPDGGWFDTSAGKPRIQVKLVGMTAWQTVGALDSYPETTATDAGGLAAGQSFQTTVAPLAEVTAVRVLGKPAAGNNPKAAYSTCAELAAFSD
jgi:hypothetical protein